MNNPTHPPPRRETPPRREPTKTTKTTKNYTNDTTNFYTNDTTNYYTNTANAPFVAHQGAASGDYAGGHYYTNTANAPFVAHQGAASGDYAGGQHHPSSYGVTAPTWQPTASPPPNFYGGATQGGLPGHPQYGQHVPGYHQNAPGVAYQGAAPGQSYAGSYGMVAPNGQPAYPPPQLTQCFQPPSPYSHPGVGMPPFAGTCIGGGVPPSPQAGYVHPQPPQRVAKRARPGGVSNTSPPPPRGGDVPAPVATPAPIAGPPRADPAALPVDPPADKEREEPADVEKATKEPEAPPEDGTVDPPADRASEEPVLRRRR